MSPPLPGRAGLAFGLVAFSVLAAGPIGCGETDLPDGVVAQVADRAITAQDVRRAMVGQIAMRHSRVTMPPYLPGDVPGCVATRRKRPSAEGASVEGLRQRCEEEGDRRESAALRFLIKGEWYRLDAKQRGESIPTDRKLALWASAHAGVRIENLRGVAGIYALRLRLSERLIRRAPTPSSAQVEKYYRAHRAHYVQEGEVYGGALVVHTRARADAIASELRAGRLARRTASARGGEVRRAFDRASLVAIPVSAGGQGEPVLRRGEVDVTRGKRGWVVYRVSQVIAPRRLALAEARPQVEADVRESLRRESVADYEKRLRAKYREGTACAAERSVPECR